MAQQKLPVGVAANQIALGADQFISGMASSDYATDGGLGTSSTGINPFAVPGAMYALASETSYTGTADVMIASCEDSQVVSPNDKLFVDASANYFTLSGTTLTKKTTGSKTYTFGTTDMVSFAGATYVTSTTDVAQWNTSTSTITENWWTGTKSKSALTSTNRHPMIVFEQLLWVADGSSLYFIDSSANVTTGAWSLPSNELITALGIDPMTGLMMVAVTTMQNYSATEDAPAYVYLYDGYSAKPRRKIPVDDMVTAFHNVGGTVYVGYGLNIGIWYYEGISFLRKLKNATRNALYLPYKHHFTHTGNILHVADLNNVLSFGEVVPGKKAWFYTAANPSSSGYIGAICNIGSSKLTISTSTPGLFSYDLTSTAGGSGTLYFNNIYFPRPVFIRKARVITTGVTNGSGGTFELIDDQLAGHRPTTSSFASTGTQYVYDFSYSGLKLNAVQPVIAFSTQSWGLVRVILWYDIAE